MDKIANKLLTIKAIKLHQTSKQPLRKHITSPQTKIIIRLMDNETHWKLVPLSPMLALYTPSPPVH